jgi:DNA polymerase elongation subunit (family B)
MDTLPRFWVPENPDFKAKLDKIIEPWLAGVVWESIPDLIAKIAEKLKKSQANEVSSMKKAIEIATSVGHIVKIESGYKSAVDGSPLWCIYTDYPWFVRELRDLFNIHYQADINYDEASRIYYGIEDMIMVPDKAVIVPSDIIPYTGHSHFPLRDYILDIETGKGEKRSMARPDDPHAPIVALTYMENRAGKPGGKIYHGTSLKANVPEIKRMLSDPKWLRENCAGVRHDSTEEIPTINPDDIEVFIAWSSNPSESEMRLLQWEAEVLSRIKATHIMAHNAEFDTEYRKARSGMGVGALRIPYLDFNQSVQVFDTMNGFKYTQENMPESLALDFISSSELGYGKIDKRAPYAEFLEGDPSRFSAYNIWDCVLVNRLDGKLNMLASAQSYADFHLTDIGNYTSTMKLVETMIMNVLSKRGEILPSISSVQKIVGNEEIKVGGFVHKAPALLEINMF